MRLPARRPQIAALVVTLALIASLFGLDASGERPALDLRTTQLTASTAYGDLPGWKLAFSDEFSTNVARGSFANAASGRYFLYTGSKDTSGNGTYSPEIIAVANGMLDIAVGTVNGVRKVAALGPLPAGQLSSHGDLLGMRVAFRIRADRMVGYKGVPLLWPRSGNWPWDGEIDFPESNFDGRPYAFMHRQNATLGSDQDWYATPTGTSWQDWHEYVIEWLPGARAEFFLDGVSIGRSTSRVPNTPMHLVLQFETQTSGGAPSSTVSGHIQVDALAVWTVATGSAAIAVTPTPVPTPSPPTPTPTPHASTTPTPTPRATPTSPTPTPGATPRPTPTPGASPTPSPSPTPNPGSTPTPTPVSAVTPTGTIIRYADTSSRVEYSAGWGTARHSAYHGGVVKFSRTAGATARFRFVGSSVSWLGPKGPTRGKAKVYVDGAYIRTVDLYAAQFDPTPRPIFSRTWATVGTHSITIRVAGTAGRPIVAIDSFNVRR